jgi:hypothetical protein
MAVNDLKTKCMLVTTYQKVTWLETSTLDLRYQGKSLENITSDKTLGVYIDKNLSWNRQVQYVCQKVSRGIALLRRIKAYLPHDVRIGYYKSFIQPHIDYCSVVWGRSSHVPRIHKLQKMAVRIICDKPRLTSSEPLFKECGILKVSDRVKLRSLTTVYKALHDETPSYVTDMFRRVSTVNTRSTRNSLKFDQLYVNPKEKLCIRRKALAFSGAMLYNELPDEIKQANSVKEFKTLVYKTLL